MNSDQNVLWILHLCPDLRNGITVLHSCLCRVVWGLGQIRDRCMLQVPTIHGTKLHKVLQSLRNNVSCIYICICVYIWIHIQNCEESLPVKSKIIHSDVVSRPCRGTPVAGGQCSALALGLHNMVWGQDCITLLFSSLCNCFKLFSPVLSSVWGRLGRQHDVMESGSMIVMSKPENVEANQS